MKPVLLLLDEPMAGIGREETERQVELLIRLKGQVTMVLVEHDMAAVFALADRISVLIRGRLLMTGKPAGRARRSAGRCGLSGRTVGVIWLTPLVRRRGARGPRVLHPTLWSAIGSWP